MLACDLRWSGYQPHREFKMTQFASSELPTQTEIQAMAGVLARRYGARAGEVARHFVVEHETIGDRACASIWDKVCAHLEQITAPQTLS